MLRKKRSPTDSIRVHLEKTQILPEVGKSEILNLRFDCEFQLSLIKKPRSIEQGSLVYYAVRWYSSGGIRLCNRDVPYLLFSRIGGVLCLFYPCTRAFAACIYRHIRAGTSYGLLYRDHDPAARTLLDSP